MAGIWTEQNKGLPGAYINVRTNEPLSITPGERGIVLMLIAAKELAESVLYTATAGENDLPASFKDRAMINEALKGAAVVKVYKIADEHTAEDVEKALEANKTTKFNTLCYPYEADEDVSEKIVNFIRIQRETEGVKCQAVLAEQEADYEGIINVVQGVVMSDGTEYTAAQTTAWIAGITAGASLITSNTAKKYSGAIDVNPRMSRTEMEAAVAAGKFVLKVDNAQNVTAVYDINSLTTFTSDKSRIFAKNRVLRTLDNIADDVSTIYESEYIGRVNNNDDGRVILRSALVDYLTSVQTLGAIQGFTADDVTVDAGEDKDAVVISVAVQPVDSVEKIYITVNCA